MPLTYHIKNFTDIPFCEKCLKMKMNCLQFFFVFVASQYQCPDNALPIALTLSEMRSLNKFLDPTLSNWLEVSS